jgi:hypothetical protein
MFAEARPRWFANTKTRRGIGWITEDTLARLLCPRPSVRRLWACVCGTGARCTAPLAAAPTPTPAHARRQIQIPEPARHGVTGDAPQDSTRRSSARWIASPAFGQTGPLQETVPRQVRLANPNRTIPLTQGPILRNDNEHNASNSRLVNLLGS